MDIFANISFNYYNLALIVLRMHHCKTNEYVKLEYEKVFITKLNFCIKLPEITGQLLFGLNFLLHTMTALRFQLSPAYFSPQEEVLFLCQLLPENKLRHSEVYLNKTAGLTKCSSTG